jgi:hypothetical protein
LGIAQKPNSVYLQVLTAVLKPHSKIRVGGDAAVGGMAGEGGAAAGAAEAGVEEDGTITALPRMRLNLPKKGGLLDLSNWHWQGIMRLGAASKAILMIVNSRLQRLLKEIGIEEQRDFSGGMGTGDRLSTRHYSSRCCLSHSHSWHLGKEVLSCFKIAEHCLLVVERAAPPDHAPLSGHPLKRRVLPRSGTPLGHHIHVGIGQVGKEGGGRQQRWGGHTSSSSYSSSASS